MPHFNLIKVLDDEFYVEDPTPSSALMEDSNYSDFSHSSSAFLCMLGCQH